MRFKLILCLALVLGVTFYSQPAQAYWYTIQLNHTNIATTAPFIRVVPTYFGITNNPMVQFSIFVLPKDNGGAELLSGSLTVKDSQETKQFLVKTQVQAEEPLHGVVPAAVPKSWVGKCKVFHLYIAANLLTNSEFSVGFTADSKWGTAGTYYVLNLEECADKK
jgi:hypothetical protein